MHMFRARFLSLSLSTHNVPTNYAAHVQGWLLDRRNYNVLPYYAAAELLEKRSPAPPLRSI